MRKSKSYGRISIRDRARKRQRKSKLQSYALIAGGLMMILAAGFIAEQANKPKVNPVAVIDYSMDDIVYDLPIHAIHEMTGPSLAEIPFLQTDGPQPQIALSAAFFDFGNIGATAVVQHEFVISNLGDAPLTISRAYTTCGCTTADFTSTIIPPGKVVIMTLTLDAGFHDVSGQTVRRGVIIENNDPNNYELEIWVQATVGTSP